MEDVHPSLENLLDFNDQNLTKFKENFKYDSIIDSGSFSHVLKAKDLQTSQTVAVKVLQFHFH